jgi:hypothetical protein
MSRSQAPFRPSVFLEIPLGYDLRDSMIFAAPLMEELHTDSIDGGHEASYGLGHVPGRGRTPTLPLEL